MGKSYSSLQITQWKTQLQEVSSHLTVFTSSPGVSIYEVHLLNKSSFQFELLYNSKWEAVSWSPQVELHPQESHWCNSALKFVVSFDRFVVS